MKKTGIVVLVFMFNCVSWSWAAFSTNQAASVVVGQPDMTSGNVNQGNNTPGANSLNVPTSVCSDNQHLFITDTGNNRVLIFNHIPNANNMTADVVIGQPDMLGNSQNQGGDIGANTLRTPYCAYVEGSRLFVADFGNNRVLIFNEIPTKNNANADVIIGQSNSITGYANQGNGYWNPSANTLYGPSGVYSDGQYLFISDYFNARILIYNQIPNHNNAMADIVIGQPDMSGCESNQGNSNPGAKTLYSPRGIIGDGQHLYAADSNNNRILIYDHVPNTHNAAADYVIGQVDMVHNEPNQVIGQPDANTLSNPYAVYSNGQSVYIAEWNNNRALIYNSVPNVNNASADIVIGQPNMTVNSGNQGNYMTPRANTLKAATSIFCDNLLLYIVDTGNNRVLIYYPLSADATPTPIFTTSADQTLGYFKAYNNQIDPTKGQQATLRWIQPQDGSVTIRIFNLLGDKIITLVNKEVYSAGQCHEVNWKGVTQDGKVVGSGIYIALIESPGFSTNTKVVVVK